MTDPGVMRLPAGRTTMLRPIPWLASPDCHDPATTGYGPIVNLRDLIDQAKCYKVGPTMLWPKG